MKKILAIICTVLMMGAAMPSTLAADTAVGEYSWDFEDGNIPEQFTQMSKEAPYNVHGDPLGQHGKTFRIWNGLGGKGQNDGFLNQNNFGVIITPDGWADNAVNDTMVIASADFMMPRYREALNVISPYNSGNIYGFEGSVQVMLDRNVVFNTGREKIIIGEVDINEWHTTAVKYSLSSADNTTADVYLDGVKVLGNITVPSLTNGINGFRLSMNCNSTDAEFAASVRADDRNEMAYFDNIYIGTNTANLEKFQVTGTSFSHATPNKVTVHFNGAADTNDFAVDTLIAKTGDTNIEIASAEWTNGNKDLVIDFGNALTFGNTYSIILPSIASASGAAEYEGGTVSFEAKAGLNIVENNFESMDSIKSVSLKSARGKELPGTIKDGALRVCCGVGGGGGDGTYGDRNQNGLEIYQDGLGNYAGYIIISWKMMVEKDNITAVMAPRSTSNGYFEGLYFGVKGTNVICNNDSTVVGTVQPGEWHTYTAKYNIAPGSKAWAWEYYLDGEKVSASAFGSKRNNCTSLTLIVNVNVDNETLAETPRYDNRGEYFNVDDMVVSTETGLYSAYTGGDFASVYGAYMDNLNETSINTYICYTNGKLRGVDGSVDASIISGLSGNACAAVYDENGKLKSVAVKGFDLEAGESAHLAWVLENVEETDKIRTFVWNGSSAPYVSANPLQ